MKKLKYFFYMIIFSVVSFSQKVFAEAYLEGENEKGKSLLENIDSSLIMANWYKIIIIAVAILCVLGLIISNIVWYIKKRNK